MIQRFNGIISPSDGQNIYSIKIKFIVKDELNPTVQLNILDLMLEENEQLHQFNTHIDEKEQYQPDYYFFNGIVRGNNTVIIPYSSSMPLNNNKVSSYLDWRIKVNETIEQNKLEINSGQQRRRTKSNRTLYSFDELYIKGSTSEQFLNNDPGYYIKGPYLRVSNWDNKFNINTNGSQQANFLVGYYNNLKIEGEEK